MVSTSTTATPPEATAQPRMPLTIFSITCMPLIQGWQQSAMSLWSSLGKSFAPQFIIACNDANDKSTAIGDCRKLSPILLVLSSLFSTSMCANARCTP